MEFIEKLNLSLSSFYFWLSWLIIPFIIEIIPKIVILIQVVVSNLRKKDPEEKLTTYPFITVIIPTYNSAATLAACVSSIVDSTYPLKKIQVIIADNQSSDNLKEVYQQIHKTFPKLFLQYMNSSQGKASGLNAAIYQAKGSYVINIDSDGVLAPKALEIMVTYLENHPEVPAAGGTVMTTNQQKKKMTFLQINEFFEYCQIFLFGRQYSSKRHEVFTLAGAFSVFRKEILFQTKLYNTASIAEDTDITFQIHKNISDEIVYCPDAIYYTDGILNFQSLFNQRERWQRGELAVVQDFSYEGLKLKNFFSDFVVRQLIMADTFAFLKMIWLFSAVLFLMMNFSGFVLGMSYVFLYLIYVALAAVYWLGILIVLPKNSVDFKRILRNPQVILTYPFYNFIVFWIRLVGIIHHFTRVAKWSATSFTKDWNSILQVIRQDWKLLFGRKKGD